MRPAQALGAAFLLLALAGLVITAGSARTEAATAGAPRPNVVVVMSDDQTLDSMRFMPRVESKLGRDGATFPHYYDNYSLCCPSRATLLTGQYVHNHGVWSNVPPTGGFDKLDSSNTLAVWLRRAGYYTALVGKYLNGYDAHRSDVPPLVPAGYSEWQGTTITATYYDFEFNEDGVLVPYGHDASDYQTDVISSKAVDLIDRRAPSSQPFFLWVSYLAPHSGGPDPNPHPPADCAGSAQPAPRHAETFDSEPLPRPPNFNEADVSDKPLPIRSLPRLSGAEIDEVTRAYRCRIESLLAIDEGVARIIGALKRSGELENTLVLYTSDNGFFSGEHRLPKSKRRIYEESIHLPLLIRGPGFPAGSRVNELAINADLAPTILAAARARAARRIDGRDLRPLAQDPGRERGRELLIVSQTARAIRTQRYLYAEYVRGAATGARELYDLERDPYELRSLHADPAYAAVEAALRRRLDRLRHCSGKSCRRLPAIELRMRARRGAGDCLEPPLRIDPVGPDLGQVRLAELFVDGRPVASDRSRPFIEPVPGSAAGPGSTPMLRLRLSLLDGRRLTRDARVRLCR